MWPVFLIAFVIFALAVAGMAIGVIVRRKAIKGSCGGLANLRDERGRPMCEACSHPSPDCRGEQADDRRAAGVSRPVGNAESRDDEPVETTAR